MKALIKTFIAAATLFLLLGQGEAIFAAPVLVPALWWAHQSSRARAARAGLTFLAAIVMTEVGWFLAFSASRERQPMISIAPSLGFVGTILFFWLRGRSRDRGPVTRSRAAGLGAMNWTEFDLGGAFAFVHAGAISAFSLGLIVVHPDEFDPVWAAFFIGSSAAAWLGFWAWRRRRWLVAAGSFFLALGWPGGFAIELTGPLVIGLVFVSLFRAWQDRPARRKRTESLDRGR